ncbi:MAG TPA: hypothetical protein VLA19_03340 [Herpetosiphonaceae bacterium]|nr:hypothetical protein [Herpetosiphonaceae bacterium]
MRTIETTATISPDGTLMVQVPSDVAPGQHRIVLVIDPEADEPPVRTPRPPLEYHVSPWEGWPADSTFRREDIYCADGR